MHLGKLSPGLAPRQRWTSGPGGPGIMASHGAYGERIGERFRLSGTPALVSRKLQNPSVAVTRLRTDAVGHGMTQPIPREDAHIVALQLRHLTAHELWVNGKAVPAPAYRAGTISAVHLDGVPRAHLGRPFDCIQFYIPGRTLERVADESGVPRPSGYSLKPGVSYDDPVIRHLGLAMLPALNRPKEASPLFVEQVTEALLTHITHTYGGSRLEPASGGLAPWQLRRATEMLSARGGRRRRTGRDGACLRPVAQPLRPRLQAKHRHVAASLATAAPHRPGEGADARLRGVVGGDRRRLRVPRTRVT